jgi:hypothetical protein
VADGSSVPSSPNTGIAQLAPETSPGLSPAGRPSELSATVAGFDGLLIRRVAAHLRATATGRHFTVRGARGFTRRVLAITRLDEVLTFAQERTFP